MPTQGYCNQLRNQYKKRSKDCPWLSNNCSKSPKTSCNLLPLEKDCCDIRDELIRLINLGFNNSKYNFFVDKKKGNGGTHNGTWWARWIAVGNYTLSLRCENARFFSNPGIDYRRENIPCHNNIPHSIFNIGKVMFVEEKSAKIHKKKDVLCSFYGKFWPLAPIEELSMEGLHALEKIAEKLSVFSNHGCYKFLEEIDKYRYYYFDFFNRSKAGMQIILKPDWKLTADLVSRLFVKWVIAIETLNGR